MPPLAPVASVLSAAFTRFDAAASRTVQTAVSGDGLEQSVADMAQAKVGVETALSVVRTADEMTGALLDMLA